MPFTVITLTNVPNSLRGDLTKWMQEIATGVYVGNFNSRVREQLWKRVCDNVKKGEATLSYAARNEIGYTFDSYQTGQEVVQLDGIPLVRYPAHQREGKAEEKFGFSKAYQSHMHHKMEHRSGRSKSEQKSELPAYVLLDLETTGLDEENNRIIEIGAIKVSENQKEEFHRLLLMDGDVTDFITELTGITKQTLLEEGCDRRAAVEAFDDFIGDSLLVGYNIKFDIKFLESEFRRLDLRWKVRRHVDILSIVRKEKLFLDNYKLPNVLLGYGIDKEVPHRALEDVKLLAELLPKLNGFEAELKRKG
jgi:CRISPR-associated protein Cas2